MEHLTKKAQTWNTKDHVGLGKQRTALKEVVLEEIPSKTLFIERIIYPCEDCV